MNHLLSYYLYRSYGFSKALVAIALLLLATTALAKAYVYDANTTLVGNIYSTTVSEGNTLIDIAREFGLGFEEIEQANPDLDPWVPGEGNLVILPRQFILPKAATYTGIFINLAEMRLYHYEGGGKVLTYPISIGRDEWRTPVSGAKVIEKIVNPVWYPPKSVRRESEEDGDPLPMSVPPGEDNPLGKYAIQLNLPGYFIHGTNRPEGIGMRVTHGCIRMRPEDIEALFPEVDRGSNVIIEFWPHKVTLHKGVIYFEAHRGGYNAKSKDYLASSIAKVAALAKKNGIRVDWERMIRVAKFGRGIPTPLNMDSSTKIVAIPKDNTASKKASSSYLF